MSSELIHTVVVVVDAVAVAVVVDAAFNSAKFISTYSQQLTPNFVTLNGEQENK